MRQLQLHTRIGERDKEVIEAVALVDDEDYEELRRYTWYLKVDNANSPEHRHYSIGRSPVETDASWGKNKTNLILLNRHIMGIDDPEIQVRFKDRDPLNCQKSNLYINIDGHELRKLRAPRPRIEQGVIF